MMVGLPGSGKSTYVQSIAAAGQWVSRDKIRFANTDLEQGYFSNENKVFELFVQEIVGKLNNGEDVYADATHISWGSRKKLLQAIGSKILDRINVNVIVMETPFNICIERNAKRAGTACVPQPILESMRLGSTDPATDPFKYNQIIRINQP